MVWLDSYERRARLIPGLAALLPISGAMTILGWRESPAVSAVIALIMIAGGPVLLVTEVRRRGRRIERQLFPQWGGSPTVQLLRADPTRADPIRDQRRESVEAMTGKLLPTALEQARDPEGTDSRYEAAVSALRTKVGTSTVSPLVFEENKNYGLQRNLLGFRPVGLGVSSALFLALSFSAALQAATKSHWTSIAGLLLAAALCVCLFIFWMFYPTETRVQESGQIYAERLLDAAFQSS